MKPHLRSIFLLMTACILGINGFQGYWLYTTYQVQVQQFTRTVSEALWQTFERQQVREAERLFRQKLPGGDSLRRQMVFEQFGGPAGGRQLQVFITDSIQRRTARPVKRRPGPDVMAYTFRPRVLGGDPALPPDSLADRLSRRILVNWRTQGTFNLRRTDSLYRAELLARDVTTPFVLDTFVLNLRPRPGERVRFPGEIRVSNHRAGLAIQTQPVPVNPVRELFMQASFASPTSYIFRKMGWLLGGSVLLLALTTGCFLFMLHTILRQKKLSELKTDFINNMTHELKTPLATVSAAVEALQHFGALQDPQKTATYLSISKNELQRLSELVEKVLNLAVEEHREFTLNPEPTNPADLVGEVVARHNLRTDKSVEFDLTMPPGEPIQADRLHLGNALSNLLDNAIKYSGERVKIQIRGHREAGGYTLSVQDDGLGIPKNYQTAIFDRFFRVPTGDLHPVKGFGLGLYYVRQVVERHGGRIEVQSEPGRGSRFLIWIPIRTKSDSGLGIERKR